MKIRDIFESIDKIDQLIKRSGYSEADIEDGTEGLCGTFALALYRFLKKNGVPCQLVAFGYKPDPWDEFGHGYKLEFAWRHIAVQVGNRIYDITGRVVPGLIHVRFETDQIVHMDERAVVKELRELSELPTG